MISYVHKFGGSLMGNGKLLTNVIKTIKHDKINNIRPIFVVSALNPNADKRTGTTTLLEKAYSSNNEIPKLCFLVLFNSNYSAFYD